MVPSTVVMLRVRSFALAFFGRIRKDQEAPFAVAGRKSFALKRIFAGILFISVLNALADRSSLDAPTSIQGQNQSQEQNRANRREGFVLG
jgi:hypothetical protein